MSREPLNDQELLIVREGLAAADLLASDALRDVIRSLMIEQFAIITESKPEDLARREASYNLTQGLKAIEAELTMRVQNKDTIERRLDADAVEHSEHDDLIDDANIGSID